ncbi:MAG: alpha/beta hydrolase [Phaeodactylibacter sp.]|nr:alpha/beta hydrolase [Phaeodactylibacter sp.]
MPLLKIIGITLLVLLLLMIGLLQLNFFSFREKPEAMNAYLEAQGVGKAEFLRVQAGAHSVHYARIGAAEKPLVVMVHGSPGSMKDFKSYLGDAELLEVAQVIAVDRPGFGYSDYGKTEASLELQAAAVKAVIDRHPSEQVILVGHSYGGPVIARVAMDYPELVDGLVIVAGSIDPELEPREWWRKPADWALMRAILPESMVVCNQEIMALYDELMAMLPMWQQIRCPVVVVQGTDDKLVPAGNAYFAERMLADGQQVQLEMVEGGNHFIIWTMQDEIVQVLKNLIEH